MAIPRYFGAKVKRLEDPRFLLGRAQYVDDIKMPNMACVAFVRSTYAHAKIKAIDASKALALPGVVKVLTGEEASKKCKPLEVEIESVEISRKVQERNVPSDRCRKGRFRRRYRGSSCSEKPVSG